MKKIISSVLAVLMMLSLCAACMINVAADEEPKYELKAVVTMKPDDDTADYAKTRFIFNITKADLTELGGDPENVSDYGYEIAWGINVDDGAWEGGDHWGADHPSMWLFDEKGDLCLEVSFDTASQNAGEQYAASKAGKMKGMMRNFQGDDASEANKPKIDKVLYDANSRPAHPDLKANTQIDGKAACVLTIQASEDYYAEGGSDTPTPPPQTADFTAAIVAVAVLALGATVVVSKKKH